LYVNGNQYAAQIEKSVFDQMKNANLTPTLTTIKALHNRLSQAGKK
jgi:hypothetical protein